MSMRGMLGLTRQTPSDAVCPNPVSFFFFFFLAHHPTKVLLTLDGMPIDHARLQGPVQRHQRDRRQPLRPQRPGECQPAAIADARARASLGGTACCLAAAAAASQQLGRPQPHHRSAGSTLVGLFRWLCTVLVGGWVGRLAVDRAVGSSSSSSRSSSSKATDAAVG